MKAAAFDYLRADSVAEAVGALGGAEDAAILAGGQSLGPMLNLRLARPDLVVDIGGIAALAGAETGAGGVRYGALVTHAAVEDGAVPDPARGMMAHVARGIAWRGVRNMGTLAGSLAHADPAADWPAALLALDAVVHLQGPGGARDVTLDAFLDAPFETARGPDEIVTAVTVPALPAGAVWRYAKACRKVGEFAHALAAVVRTPDGARVVLGATHSRPVLLCRAAQALAAGAVPDRDALAGEIAAAAPELSGHALRRQTVLMQRTLAEAAADG